jgi:raffinose/stachyose/melibiose transport system permease protein
MTALIPTAQAAPAPVTPTSKGRRSRTRRLRRATSGAALVALTLVMLLPVLMVVNVSLRPRSDTATGALTPPSHLAWSNYADVFREMGYLRSVANTLLITAASVALVIVAASACAWAIARHRRSWTTWAYHTFVSGLTIPVFVLLTPLYLLMRQLGLLDDYLSVILANAALNLPLAVLLYASFLKSIPTELEDAAAVDGCGLVATYWRVVLPLLKPATATLAIFISLGIWNDLILPLLFLNSPDKSTVTLSVYSFLGTGGRFQAAQLFPAVVLSTLPLFILFLLLQRRIVAGIAAGMGKS